MKISFSDKEKIREILSDNSIKKFIIKLKNSSLIYINKDILAIIRSLNKIDRKFSKNLFKTESNFINFIIKINEKSKITK